MNTRWYGCIGFLSLLGLVGVFTPERIFLVFFAFGVNFQYFFHLSDEMAVEYMNRSAARAFFAGLLATTVVTLFALAGQEPSAAFATGMAIGWGASVFVYSVSIAYYSFKEQWGTSRD